MKRFKKIYLEITNVCNLSCSFCPKTKRKAGFITPSDFEERVKSIDHLTDYLYFHLMGEPLLHPQLNELLSIAEKYNKKVIITTNGTLIDEKKSILLISKALYKVVFSVHSFEANESSLMLDEYLKSIINFCKEASRNTKIISALRLWNLEKGKKNDKNLANDIIFDIIKNEFDIDEIDTTFLFGTRGMKLSEKIYLQTAERFEWPDMDKDIISDRAFCYGLRDHFAVQVDGSVVPCCLDNDGQIYLGNIKEQSFDDILMNDRARRIYDGFSGRTACEDLCRRCEFVTRFS